MLAGAQDTFRHRHPVTFLLDRRDGRAGSDLAKDRQLAAVVGGGGNQCRAVDQLGLEGRAAFGRRGGGGLLRKFDHFQRAGPVGQASKEAAFLQSRDQTVDAGLGR